MDYVLHDKDGQRTSERVGNVAMLNLATDDPRQVAREMQTTVDAAKDLQARARVEDGKRPGASGRGIKNPVYTFSLSWHPSDQVTAPHMAATARNALKVLGLQDHQAVIVEHRDRPHRHVHVIVNLAHPGNGRIANLRQDERKLDRWAHQYEVSQKMVRSLKRAAKHEERSRNSEAAQRKADMIVDAKRERVAKIKQQQAAARQELAEEGSKIWTEYREKRQAAYDKYKPLIAQARAGRIPSMGLDLKPSASLFPKSPEWVQLARAMKPVLGHLPMAKYREFITARQAFVPHNMPNAKSRIFKWSKEAATKADLQPLAQQKVVQPGRPWLQRRERVDQLKLARHAELAEVSLEHQRKTEILEAAYIKLDQDNAEDWKTLKVQSDKIWSNWRAEFQVPEIKRDYKDWNRLYFEPRNNSPKLKPEFNKPVTKAVTRAAEVKPAEVKPQEKAEEKNEETRSVQTQISAGAQTDQTQSSAETPVKLLGKQRYRYEVDPQDAKRQFADAIREFGLDLKGKDPEMDGQYHSVPLIGQSGNKKSGAYRGYLDGRPAGSIRNHKTGVTVSWKADGERKPISLEQGALFDKQAAHKKQERDAAIIAQHDNAALKATVRLEQTHAASPSHPYLQKKGVDRHGIRQDREGNLVIPLQDINGRIRNIQTISLTGNKLYLEEAQKKATFYVLGTLSEERPIIIAEGFATAATLREATGHTVVVALDSGNLKPVAMAIREKYPKAQLIFAADNDRHLPLRDPPLPNVGKEKAEEAALAVEGAVIMAQFGPEAPERFTDFNDYASLNGLSAVASQFPSVEQENEQSGIEHDFDPGGFEHE